jgi:hypothetical protein
MSAQPTRISERGQVDRVKWPVHTGAWESQLAGRANRLKSILHRSRKKGEIRSVMRTNLGKRELFYYWMRKDARRRHYSHYRTSKGGSPGRSFVVDSFVERGEQLGEYVGNIVRKCDCVDNGKGIDLPGGLLVLDCHEFAEAMICNASMCNAYQGLSHFETGERAFKTCIIVNGPPGSNRIYLRAYKDLAYQHEQFTTYGKSFGGPEAGH